MWYKGKPTEEGCYYACFLSPLSDRMVIYGEIIIIGDNVTYYDDPVTEVFGWCDPGNCPYDPSLIKPVVKEQDTFNKIHLPITEQSDYA